MQQSAKDSDPRALREKAFARMQKGIPLGGAPYPKREDLYDRGREDHGCHPNVSPWTSQS